MTIGGSIALIVIGAILAFAVEYDLNGLSISTVGIILMIGGLIGLAFGLFSTGRSRTVATRTVREAPVARERVVEEPVARRRVVEEPVVQERVVDDREVY